MIINAVRIDAYSVRTNTHSSQQTLMDREQYGESHEFHGDLPDKPLVCELLIELRRLPQDTAGVFYPNWAEIADKGGCDISDIEVASWGLECGGWLEGLPECETRPIRGYKLMGPACDDEPSDQE